MRRPCRSEGLTLAQLRDAAHVGGAAYDIEKDAAPVDILFLLIPFSVGLVLLVLAALYWAVERGQFDDVEREGERILHDD